MSCVPIGRPAYDTFPGPAAPTLYARRRTTFIVDKLIRPITFSRMPFKLTRQERKTLTVVLLLLAIGLLGMLYFS